MITNINKRTLFHNTSIITFTLYMMTLFTFVDHPNLFRLSQVAFILFFGSACIEILNKGKIHLHRCTIYFISIFIMFLISYFWAYESSIVLKHSITVFQISLLCILIYHVLINENSLGKLVDIILVSGLFMCIYGLFLYGPQELINNMLYGYRLGSEISQENTFGMNAAITTILCFYKALHKRKIFYVIFLMPFLMAMSSGSKKALLMIILGIAILIFLKFGFRHIFKLIFSVSIAFVLLWGILQLPLFNMIDKRMEEFLNVFSGNGHIDGSTQLRRDFVIFGLKSFVERPFLGYGTGNFAAINTIRAGFYSHNNFVELLVNNGIIGFMIYYSAYLHLIRGLSKLAFKKDNIAVILLVIIVISLVMQFGVVVYYDKLQYIYLTFGFAYLSSNKKSTQKIMKF
jgi:hypothetical protein